MFFNKHAPLWLCDLECAAFVAVQILCFLRSRFLENQNTYIILSASHFYVLCLPFFFHLTLLLSFFSPLLLYCSLHPIHLTPSPSAPLLFDVSLISPCLSTSVISCIFHCYPHSKHLEIPPKMQRVQFEILRSFIKLILEMIS